jgi:hypothetical protein
LLSFSSCKNALMSVSRQILHPNVHAAVSARLSAHAQLWRYHPFHTKSYNACPTVSLGQTLHSRICWCPSNHSSSSGQSQPRDRLARAGCEGCRRSPARYSAGTLSWGHLRAKCFRAYGKQRAPCPAFASTPSCRELQQAREKRRHLPTGSKERGSKRSVLAPPDLT